MPLEVTVDVIPHGFESARKRIARVRVTQVAKLDANPGGLRRYRVDPGGRIVEHYRRDGWAVLAAKCLEATSD